MTDFDLSVVGETKKIDAAGTDDHFVALTHGDSIFALVAGELGAGASESPGADGVRMSPNICVVLI